MKLVILASIDFEEKVNLEEVYNEWDAQIISFMKSGRRPDHIDSHHNVHGKIKVIRRSFGTCSQISITFT